MAELVAVTREQQQAESAPVLAQPGETTGKIGVAGRVLVSRRATMSPLPRTDRRPNIGPTQTQQVSSSVAGS